MPIYQDGDFTIVAQNGAKQVSLPLIQEQEYYCRLTNRNYLQISTYFDPKLYQRINWQTFSFNSDDGTQSNWIASEVTPSAFGIADPEGNTNGTLISETSATAEHAIQVSTTLPADEIKAACCFYPNGRRYVQIKFFNGTDGEFGNVFFDLTNLSIISGNGKIKRLNAGWIYCEVTATATASNSDAIISLLDDGQNVVYAGDPSKGIYFWRFTTTAGSGENPPLVLTTSETRTVNTPLRDVDDPISFLVDETGPDQGSLEVGVAAWSRTYSRVSKRTTIPSSIIVSKPSINTNGQYTLGTDFFVFQPDVAIQSFDIYTATDVISDSGIPAFYPTGGSYTLSWRGITSATIAYNASASTIETALNANSDITAVGGVTVTGSYTATSGIIVNFDLLKNNVDWTPSFTGIGLPTKNLPGPYAYFNSGHATGGSFTFTIFGDTTSAIAFNATKEDIQAAIDALASMIALPGFATALDVIPVPIPSGGLSYQYGIFFNYELISPNSSALTPSGVVIGVTEGNPNLAQDFPTGSLNQFMSFDSGGTRSLVAPAHGIGVGDQIFVQASVTASTSPVTSYASTFFVPITNFTVTGDDTIDIKGGKSDPVMISVTISKIGRRSVVDYFPGPRNCRCKRITDYYLPGYTFGIDTADDIPVLDAQSDGAAFLEGLLGGSTLNYVVGEIGVWKGPILYSTVITIDTADVAQFQSPAVAVIIQGAGTGRVDSNPAGIATTSSQIVTSFANGTEVTFVATPDAGSTFSGWSGTLQGQSSTSSTIDLTTGQPISLIATFDTAGDDDVTVYITPDANGSVVSDPAGIAVTGFSPVGASETAQFTTGTYIELTAINGINSLFDHWTLLPSSPCASTIFRMTKGTTAVAICAVFIFNDG